MFAYIAYTLCHKTRPKVYRFGFRDKDKKKKKTKEEKIKDKHYEKKTDRKIETRTTNVVRNAGYARSRYTLKFFLINQWMNESIN